MSSSCYLFSSNTTSLAPTTKPTKPLTPFSPTPISLNPRRYPISPISVTSPSVSYPQPQQPDFNVGYLQTEFGSHGVSFTELGTSSYVVKMVLENGSSATLLLPSGLITSYKPKMWHGTTAEVLHTLVEERAGNGGGPVILGGVSLALDCIFDQEFSWSPTSWVLGDVKGSSEESIQVEIISRDSGKTVEVKHNITLKDDTLRSEISVSNLSSSQLQLTGSILGHLTVSTPDATYACGLERSNFFNRPPLSSDLCIIPPDLSKNKETGSTPLWPLPSFAGLFPAKRVERDTEEETTGEEDDNYKHLTDAMSKIYTSAPRNFTIIDRGKRNSVIVRRKGFEELYMYSPGSRYDSYGKYSYICVGQSAILKPIMLAPEQLWRGEQQLHNPNL